MDSSKCCLIALKSIWIESSWNKTEVIGFSLEMQIYKISEMLIFVNNFALAETTFNILKIFGWNLQYFISNIVDSAVVKHSFIPLLQKTYQEDNCIFHHPIFRLNFFFKKVDWKRSMEIRIKIFKTKIEKESLAQISKWVTKQRFTLWHVFLLGFLSE